MLVACTGVQGSAPRVAASHAVATTSASDAGPGPCPEPATAGLADTQYREGRALLEQCDELCIKSPQGQQQRARAFERLLAASRAGHLDAQALYGIQRFGELMTIGTEPSLRSDYVRGIRYLRLAARRQHPAAAAFVPGIRTSRVTAQGTFQPTLEPPLSELPREWVRSAFEEADTELGCYAEADPTQMSRLGI